MPNEDRSSDKSKNQEHPHGQPPGQAKKPQPKTGEATGESQKSQIVQYFRSQGRQDDDVIWETSGMKLRLKDLA